MYLTYEVSMTSKCVKQREGRRGSLHAALIRTLDVVSDADVVVDSPISQQFDIVIGYYNGKLLWNHQ